MQSFKTAISLWHSGKGQRKFLRGPKSFTTPLSYWSMFRSGQRRRCPRISNAILNRKRNRKEETEILFSLHFHRCNQNMFSVQQQQNLFKKPSVCSLLVQSSRIFFDANGVLACENNLCLGITINRAVQWGKINFC